jgi:hypothetical protein
MTTIVPLESKDLNDPYYKDFLTRAKNDFGLDPDQVLDMNDPMTKLTMTIVLTTLEQGRNNYSYDQYVKGIAKSIGIDPGEYDKEVNQTQLGFENATGTSGYVSPAAPAVVKGGSTISMAIAMPYISAVGTGTGVDLMTSTSLGGFGGYINKAVDTVTNGIKTITGAFTGSTAGTTITPARDGSIAGASNIVVLSAGTNDYKGNPAAVQANIDSTVKGLQEKGYEVVIIRPKEGYSSEAVDAVAAKYGLTKINPTYPADDFHPKSYAEVAAKINEATGGKAGQARYIGDSIAKGTGDAAKGDVSQTRVGAGVSEIKGYVENTDRAAAVPGPYPVERPPEGFLNASRSDNYDRDGNIVGRTYTNSDGRQVVVSKMADGSVTYVNPKSGNTVDPTTGNETTAQGELVYSRTVGTGTGEIQVYDLPPTTRLLDKAPSAAEIGVPSGSGLNVQTTYNADGSFQKAVYTNGDVTKTIYADGKIEQNGATITNYFGNQTAITSPPTAAQAGFSEDTLVNARYDENNKLVSVQYTPPAANPQFDTGETYTLDVRTGKLVNDVTGEVQGTVSTKVDNGSNQAQYNYLQQQKSNIDAEAEARAGTDNPMSAGEYLQRTQAIRSQESALTNGYIPNEAGQSVQVASLNVGTAKDFVDTTSVVTSNQTEIPLPPVRPNNLDIIAQPGYNDSIASINGTPLSSPGIIAQPGYNNSIASITGTPLAAPIDASRLDPTQIDWGRNNGQPAQTIVDAVPTNAAVTTAATKLEPVYDMANGAFMGYQEVPATVNPAASSNTNTPAVIVDDPSKFSNRVLPNQSGGGTAEQPFGPSGQVNTDYYGNQPVTAMGADGQPIQTSSTFTSTSGPSMGFNAPGDQFQGGTNTGQFGIGGVTSDQGTVASSTPLSTPTSTDKNGTTTSGDSESQGGANDASSAGNPVASAAGAGMGGGGC